MQAPHRHATPRSCCCRGRVERRVLIPKLAELEGEALVPVHDQLFNHPGASRGDQKAQQELWGGEGPQFLEEIQELDDEVAWCHNRVQPLFGACPFLAFRSCPLEAANKLHHGFAAHVLWVFPNITDEVSKSNVQPYAFS